jgi:transcription antitermination factor NusG
MFWACAQLQPSRFQLALRTLERLGYPVYAPMVRTQRAVPGRGRRLEGSAPLFVGYAFVLIHSAWYAAHYAPGVTRLLCAGDGHPLHVPDATISDLRARERHGLIELPRQRSEFEKGDRIQVIKGPLTGLHGLYADMRPGERILILLSMLGAQRPIVLPRGDIRSLER